MDNTSEEWKYFVMERFILQKFVFLEYSLYLLSHKKPKHQILGITVVKPWNYKHQSSHH
jgi:hypothetical protein